MHRHHVLRCKRFPRRHRCRLRLQSFVVSLPIPALFQPYHVPPLIAATTIAQSLAQMQIVLYQSARHVMHEYYHQFVWYIEEGGCLLESAEPDHGASGAYRSISEALMPERRRRSGDDSTSTVLGVRVHGFGDVAHLAAFAALSPAVHARAWNVKCKLYKAARTCRSMRRTG